MPLRLFVSLIVSALVFLSFAGYGVYSAYVQTELRAQHIRNLVAEVGRSVSDGAANDLLAGNLDNIQDQLQHTVSIEPLRELVIADASGQIVSQVRRDAQGVVRVVVASLSQRIPLHPESTASDERYTRLIPIERGERVGWVRVTGDLAELGEMRRVFFKQTLISALGASLVTSALLLLFLNHINRYIETVAAFAKGMNDRRGDELHTGSSILELEALRSALNQASRLLAQQIAELESKSAEQERTNALLQQSLSDLASKQLALDQHAIVTVTDRRGAIVYVNDKLTELSGYSREELIGSNPRILKSGMQDGAYYRQLWATIGSGRVWHGEFVNRKKSGELYWVTVTIVPTLDPQGKPLAYTSIQTDVTERKRSEQELQRSQEELEQAVENYRQAGLEIARAREHEASIGDQIQRTLLFSAVPAAYGSLSIALRSEPSQGMDGDFYEYFSFGPNCLDLVVGDVMGKGTLAALIGAAAKEKLNRSVSWLLTRANHSGYRPEPAAIINALHERIAPQLLDLESFVTLAYLRIELELGRLTLVDAGHPPLIIVGRGGLRFVSGANLPIGVVANERYEQHSVEIAPGDLLFLYSDGVTEARNAEGDEFGSERLGQLVQDLYAGQLPAQTVVQAVRHAVDEFGCRDDIRDDRTCVALKLADSRAAAALPRCIDLPWALDELAPLRQEIENCGRRAGLDEAQIASFTLAGFEAATNAIRHNPRVLADATLQCCLEPLEHGLAVSLYYLGARFDPDAAVPDFSGDSESGFGLYIIRNSVDEVIYDSPAPGVCRVRLEMRCGAGPA